MNEIKGIIAKRGDEYIRNSFEFSSSTIQVFSNDGDSVYVKDYNIVK